MYTIVMRNDKSLITSVRTTLFQRESLVDKIQFLLPQFYEDKKLSDFIVFFKYVDQANVARTQRLALDENLYKDMFRYVIDVDIGITKFAGNITGHLSFLNLNLETGLKEEVLHSGEITIEITPLKDLYAFTADESLEIIDRAMLELEAKTKALDLISTAYDAEKADNIHLDINKSSIHLTSNGQKIGDEISLENLGDALVDATESGMTKVITEEELEIEDGSGNTVKYQLQLDQDNDELCLLANGVIVNRIKTKDIGESIVDSTEEGLNKVIT